MGAVKNSPKINVSQCHPRPGRRQWTKESSRAQAHLEAQCVRVGALCARCRAIAGPPIASLGDTCARHRKHVNHLILEVKVDADSKSKSRSDASAGPGADHIMVMRLEPRGRGAKGCAIVALSLRTQYLPGDDCALHN